MASLAVLDAKFVEVTISGWRHVDTLAEADGVKFLCPACYAENGGPIGTHMVLCWFLNRVPDDLRPGPGRWVPSGTGLADLSFVGPAAASVDIGCWHGFVRDGDAT